MDEKKVARNGRAFGVNRVEADTRYIDKNYRLRCYPENRITQTGLLEVAALKPKRKGLPEFVFRWDENADTLDVDIMGVPDDVRRSFRRGIHGYAGHHTKRVSKDKVFEVSIRTPEREIFCGSVITPLHRELELTASVGFRGDLRARKISGDTKSG